MRAGLKWTFALSTCASAVALFWPMDAEQSIAIIPLPRAYVATAIDLPGVLPQQTLQATKKDPFASLPSNTLANASVTISQPEPPRAPPMTYRYLGSFTNPDGMREIYLSRGDRTVSARQGSQLDGGYVVEGIDAVSIKVLHATTQTRIDIPIAQNKESP